jgi:hypothetical protein
VQLVNLFGIYRRVSTGLSRRCSTVVQLEIVTDMIQSTQYNNFLAIVGPSFQWMNCVVNGEWRVETA